MKKAIVILLILGLAGTAAAVDLKHTNELPEKRAAVVGDNTGTPDGREGGETIATAFPIPSLPYSDTGNTCDNLDDYDEACAYTGSTSPDVVYSYTAPNNQVMLIDLCYSTYDTKVYVYDAAMNLVACNDDYYFDPPCGTYTSYVEASAFGGQTYYIVVDGYGGDCGDYALDIGVTDMCEVDCPTDAVLEGEPHLYDGYADATNGGCNSTPYVFGAIDWINSEPGHPDHGYAWLCARSGWYLSDTGSESRDTDWFEVYAAASGMMEFTVTSEYPVNMFVLNTDCADIQLLHQATSTACVPTTITWPVTAGDFFWLWVGPLEFSGPVTEFRYFAKIGGNSYDTVPNEDKSWSDVKTMFR